MGFLESLSTAITVISIQKKDFLSQHVTALTENPPHAPGPGSKVQTPHLSAHKVTFYELKKPRPRGFLLMQRIFVLGGMCVRGRESESVLRLVIVQAQSG